MKKILITLFLFLSLYSSTYAVNTIYLEPDVSFLPASSNIWTASPTDRIAQTETVQFCTDLNSVYISHTTDTTTSNRAIYSTSWDTDSPPTGSSHSVIWEITCDSYTSSTLTWSLLFMNQNQASWDYTISEDFLVWLIVRLVLSLMFFTLMWKFTIIIFKTWRSLSPYISLWKN